LGNEKKKIRRYIGLPENWIGVVGFRSKIDLQRPKTQNHIVLAYLLLGIACCVRCEIGRIGRGK
jgi:hypothetical protein